MHDGHETFMLSAHCLPAGATAEAAAESLRASAGRPAAVEPLQLDVASRSSVAAAVRWLRAEHDQQLDCVVNNAGVNTVSWSQRGWDIERAVNFEGPVRLSEELAPTLRPGALEIFPACLLWEHHI